MSTLRYEEEEDSPPPASGVARRQVAVALVGPQALDGSLAYARGLAAQLGAPLHAFVPRPTPVSAVDVPRLLGVSPEALEGAVIDVEVGDPLERLVSYVRRHPGALLVVPFEPGGEPFGISSTASRAVLEAPAELILVRGAPPPRIERVLVPLDGTPSTAAAIAPAGELARRVGASLDIVLVGEAHAKAMEPGGMQAPQYVDQPQHEWAAFAREFVQRFLGGFGHCPEDVPTRFHMGAGDPTHEILRFAGLLRPDLIALAWHGDTAHEHGHVFRGVVRAADTPVLVLRR